MCILVDVRFTQCNDITVLLRATNFEKTLKVGRDGEVMPDPFTCCYVIEADEGNVVTLSFDEFLVSLTGLILLL